MRNKWYRIMSEITGGGNFWASAIHFVTGVHGHAQSGCQNCYALVNTNYKSKPTYFHQTRPNEKKNGQISISKYGETIYLHAQRKATNVESWFLFVQGFLFSFPLQEGTLFTVRHPFYVYLRTSMRGHVRPSVGWSAGRLVSRSVG